MYVGQSFTISKCDINIYIVSAEKEHFVTVYMILRNLDRADNRIVCHIYRYIFFI